MDISLAAASQLVEKLVKHDFIERTQNETDRRVRHISLSAKGKSLIKKGMEQRYHLLDEIAATLNADESAKVAEALIILTEKAKKLEK
jgi:DNA-binding MarR family transcriptional regulator